MANRNTLHRSKLDGFKRWLEQDGWDLQPAKGDYEVLRARKDGACCWYTTGTKVII